MPRYKLTIEYDGTDFSGWQIQPNAPTVEQTIEDALSTILQTDIDLIGQGRTDAGVHATGQTAHVDLPEDVDADDLIYKANKLIGKEIQIIAIDEVADDFHARFDATGRQYEYTITKRWMPLKERYSWQLNQPIDYTKLEECAALLKGEFDFAGFSKFNEDNMTTLCEIQLSEFDQEGEVIKYHIRANRFLRNMVRRLIGTMVRVAQNKMTPAQFEEALRNPKSEIPTYTAPAAGLVLHKVFYKK
ncbi:tRNA pseudouridine(38-40) synthase TruA [Gracilimonas sp. BCB1]|uniref:tRNA pseudouridine(38-40) synthase TruA n=1 Tax=Gracilimonas sp. BCB1 TaxID=3152362 RepID=UPI0032D8DA79